MKSQIDQLKSEAEANYSASRWEDSAKTYEHLVGLAQENNDFALAIDFAIAAIKSWSNLPDKNARIFKLYQAIGIIGLKQAAIGFESLAANAEMSDDLKTAASYYEDAADGFSYIQNFDKAKICYNNSIKMFDKLSSKAFTEKDYENSIHLLSRTGNLYDKMKLLLETMLVQIRNLDENSRKILIEEKNKIAKMEKQINLNIAKSHEYLAIYYLQMDDPDFEPVAEKEFNNALKILEEINETQEVKKIKDKMIKLLKK